MEKKKFRNMLSWFSGIASSQAGRTIYVKEVPAGDDSLAYQCEDTLYVANHTRYDQYLTEEEQEVFHIGALVHELLHVLLTDSAEEEMILTSLNSDYERKIFHFLANAIEDPSIEWQARHHVGGILLKSLWFMIQTIYKYSQDLNPEMKPFAQYEAAMIHYGDGGFVKGSWSSKEAKEIFADSLPIFDCIIEDTSGASRVRRVEELFELTRPLWKNMAKTLDDRKDILQSTEDAMKDAGKAPQTPSASGNDGKHNNERKQGNRPVYPDGNGAKDDPNPGTLQLKQKRTETAKELEMKPSDAHQDVSGASGKESSAETSKMQNKGVSRAGTDTSGNQNAVQSVSDASKSVSKPSDGESSTSDDKTSNKGTQAPQNEDPYGDGGEEFEEIVLTEDDIADLEALIGNEALAQEEIFEDDISESICDGIDVSDRYPGVFVKNTSLNAVSAEALISTYDGMVTGLMPQIMWLEKQMARIFDADIDERVYTRSGRFEIKRTQQSRMTARVFSKHRFPADKRDMAVLIVLDESASMSGSNMHNAVNACITLMEAFSDLGIRTSVMGFTDTDRKQIHNHYGRFSKLKAERAKIVSAKAGHNTFSGFAIHYGAQILQKRKEAHKLMIVVTDGAPCSPFYKDAETGFADTKAAVFRAQKKMSVIGVGVGASTERMAGFFGDRFITVDDPADMFGALSTVLKKEVSSW